MICCTISLVLFLNCSVRLAVSTVNSLFILSFRAYDFSFRVRNTSFHNFS